MVAAAVFKPRFRLKSAPSSFRHQPNQKAFYYGCNAVLSPRSPRSELLHKYVFFFLSYLKIPSVDHAVATFFRVIWKATAQFLCFANHSAPIALLSFTLFSICATYGRTNFLLRKNGNVGDGDDEDDVTKNNIWKPEKRIWNQKRITTKKAADTHTHTFTSFLKQSKWMAQRRARELVYNAYMCVCVFVLLLFSNSNSFARFFLRTLSANGFSNRLFYSRYEWMCKCVSFHSMLHFSTVWLHIWICVVF